MIIRQHNKKLIFGKQVSLKCFLEGNSRSTLADANWQWVPYAWSSSTETFVTSSQMCTRNMKKQAVITRTKIWTPRNINRKKIREIWRQESMESFQCEKHEFENDTRVNWQPMELFKKRSWWMHPMLTKHNPSCPILEPLKLLTVFYSDAIESGICVVNAL